ncbi:glycosyltransferase family 2 protein [Mucilaginibacter sp.]|uniref:glycosyltransferase family 2 protein n=1 Tax=Mucilaginibacter sp. TaxID=1882438 RepID=UPI003B00C785
MFERTPVAPPKIVPLTKSDLKRPLWSVMIPVFNCIGFLAQTLHCVLIQDPGEKLMQIEVIDDFSTDGNVQALVEQIGQGRIKYFRQETNVGSLRNFETCINRSCGARVHLLHGDDLVLPGFYQEIDRLFNQNPEAGAAFTSNSLIDAKNAVFYKRESILRFPGIVKDFLIKSAQWPKLEPAAIVVKRSVYENLGGFYAVHYGEDWEMWTRIAANYPVAYSPKHLAAYRVLREGNITQQSYLNGQNVRDMIKVIDIIQNYLPADKRKKIKAAALKYYAVHCAKTAIKLQPTQKAAAVLQAKAAWVLDKNFKSVCFLGIFWMKHTFKTIISALAKFKTASAW